MYIVFLIRKASPGLDIRPSPAQQLLRPAWHLSYSPFSSTPWRATLQASKYLLVKTTGALRNQNTKIPAGNPHVSLPGSPCQDVSLGSCHPDPSSIVHQKSGVTATDCQLLCSIFSHCTVFQHQVIFEKFFLDFTLNILIDCNAKLYNK